MSLAAAISAVTDQLKATALELDAAIQARKAADHAAFLAQDHEAAKRAAFQAAQVALHALIEDVEDEGFDVVDGGDDDGGEAAPAPVETEVVEAVAPAPVEAPVEPAPVEEAVVFPVEPASDMPEPGTVLPFEKVA